jgi:RNA polymerase sigma factor (sigma-70 family)
MLGAAQLSDEVVRAAAEGSQPHLDQIAQAVAAQVRIMAAARLSPDPNRYDAIDDVAQASLYALVTGIHRLETRTVAGLRAFLSSIVSRKVVDHLREVARRTRAPGSPRASLDSTVSALPEAGPLWEFLSADGSSPASAAARAESVEKLLAELGRLKPEYREIVTLAFFDQLPTAEIAQRLGISRPAASMLLIRALRTLRRNLTGSSRITDDHAPRSGK